MLYQKGNVGIGIGNLPKNKRKCLYIQEGVCITKVASFTSDADADNFEKAFTYFVGISDRTIDGFTDQAESRKDAE